MSYGREDINWCIDYLTERVGMKLDGTIQGNRNMAKRVLDLMHDDFPEHDPVHLTKRIIDIAMADPYHSQRATDFRYLFNNRARLMKLGIDAKKAEKPSYTITRKV